MKLSVLMGKIPAPNPDYTGKQVANDMILALGFPVSGAAPASPDDYFVAQKTIAEHTGAIAGTSDKKQYIRAGEVTTRTGASRSFSVNGDRTIGDDFQDACLDIGILYGAGSDVVVPYVYFSAKTGKGEQGHVTIDVTADHNGGAGANDGFSLTLTSEGTPAAYAYEAVGVEQP